MKFRERSGFLLFWEESFWKDLNFYLIWKCTFFCLLLYVYVYAGVWYTWKKIENSNLKTINLFILLTWNLWLCKNQMVYPSRDSYDWILRKMNVRKKKRTYRRGSFWQKYIHACRCVVCIILWTTHEAEWKTNGLVNLFYLWRLKYVRPGSPKKIK